MTDNSSDCREYRDMKTTVNAKITIQAVSKSFPLTIDWDGMSQEDERALAQRSIVIAWQNRHRVANNGQGEWPSENPSIKAVDYRLGVRVQTVRDPVKMVEAGELDEAALLNLQRAIERKIAAGKVQG
jgi:hypothetical protein